MTESYTSLQSLHEAKGHRTISIIAAHDLGRVIGDGPRIPWRLPGDLQHFKKITQWSDGQVNDIIMGRTTYESFPDSVRPLPGRRSIVMTRNTDRQPSRESEREQIVIVHSLEEALAECLSDHVFCIGGAQIYQAFLDAQIVDDMYITLVHGHHEGDVYFPAYDPAQRDPQTLQAGLYDEKAQLGYDFLYYGSKAA